MSTDHCVVLSTCPVREEAEKLARLILKNRLAACAQLMPITSFYEWKSELHEDPEILMILKTRKDLYEALEGFIRKHHSYETPQIVCLSIRSGLPAYLEWIDAVTRDDGKG